MTSGDRARLYIDNDYVGDVSLQGTEDAWSHGQFRPSDGFARFAPLFGRWSLAMHAGAPYEPLSEAVKKELRRIECSIDRLSAKLHFEESDRWVTCAQLNIDGTLIEWKVMNWTSPGAGAAGAEDVRRPDAR